MKKFIHFKIPKIHAKSAKIGINSKAPSTWESGFSRVISGLLSSIVLLVMLLLFMAITIFPGSTEGSYEPGAPATVTTESAEPAKTVSSGDYPLTVEDDLGNDVFLKSKPVRIASGTLMTDEILLSLVDHKRLIAVTKLSEDPGISNVAGEVAGIPNKITLNVELIISISPDIVFLASWSDASKVKQLRDAGLAVFQLKSPLTIDEVEASIKKIARVVGEREKGDQIVSWMEGKLDAVHKRIASIPETNRLKVMDYGTWGSSFGAGSSWDDIVKHAGLINAVASLKADQWGNVPISKEKLVEIDPDILILPAWVWGDPTGADKFFKKIVTDPSLATVKAVKNSRVYRIPEKYKASTSQYIVYAVEELAKLAYPDKFVKK